MSASSLSTSPDPLTLPSSPLAARFARHSPVKPLVPRSTNTALSSPSKSFVMETGKADGASPWRIKVTVEAEPQDGGPVKRIARTAKVPLKTESSSSVKKSAGRRTVSAEPDSEMEIKRPQRKRKGTPIRRKTRTQPAREEPATEEDDGMLMPPHSSTSKAPSSGRSARRRSLNFMPTQRSKRLSQAREELDQALQEAVGYTGQDAEEENDDDDDVACEAPGDMTMMNEDFTMVSVETLQSMRADTSMISHRNEGDKSGLSVSYLPSSPPQKEASEQQQEVVRYPNLSDEARRARSSPTKVYEAMSWKPTGPAKVSSSPQTSSPRRTAAKDQRSDSEPSEWQRQREAVSREIEEADTSQVIVVDDTEAPADGIDEDDEEDEDIEQDEDGDIWQEEASRSLSEEEHEQPLEPATASPKLHDLFANQPLKPPRAKIPRTWRRSSGVDFTYSDSPAHIELLEVCKRSEGSTDRGSRASSGVLTPPSTDDEAHQRLHGEVEGEGEEESDINLTQPDAAATQLQQHEENVASPPPREDDVSPYFDSSSNNTSPDGEDTGLFWQSNVPHMFQRPARRPRPQRQRAMDLSELLNLDKSSPAKKSSPNNLSAAARGGGSSGTYRETVQGETQQRRYSPLHMRPVHGRSKSGSGEGSKGKVVSSPLRKSLLRSSKVQGSPLGKGTRTERIRESRPTQTAAKRSYEGVREDDGPEEDLGESTFESFASKASDQRQLLGEMAAQRRTIDVVDETEVEARKKGYTEQLSRDEEQSYENGYDSQHDEEVKAEDEYEDDEPSRISEEGKNEHHEPSRSYEEHLNLDSPQKIRVKFNDSAGHSSLLSPKKVYAPLFANEPKTGSQGTPQAQQHVSPPTITLVRKKTDDASSVTVQAQQGIFSRLTTNFWSAVVRPTGPTEVMPTPEPVYSPALRAHIRSRYGVLSSSHPWQMAHMRTLHRMLNSCTSGKSDSIIPRSTNGASLPAGRRKIVGQQQTSITGYTYSFTTSHAHVVDAFMQTLVPAHVVEAMRNGEVEMLGDATAKAYRGVYGESHGDDLVWGDRLRVRRAGSEIGVEFVVRALGDAVLSNVQTAERKARARREAAR